METAEIIASFSLKQGGSGGIGHTARNRKSWGCCRLACGASALPLHSVQRHVRVCRSNLVLTFGQFCGEIGLRIRHDGARHEQERKTHKEACKHR